MLLSVDIFNPLEGVLVPTPPPAAPINKSRESPAPLSPRRRVSGVGVPLVRLNDWSPKAEGLFDGVMDDDTVNATQTFNERMHKRK